MSEMRHIHYTISGLLRMKDRELMEHVNHPDGVIGVRVELQELIDEGVTCLVLDSTCDNKKADGSCNGHAVEDKEVK
ncbi:hypothetical protein [Aliivibrio salmonicida]|uniref:hypothetical protein n=1 Tax=Aliivibrio salmonicida TaxID=40269 RepID=UPI003D112795